LELFIELLGFRRLSLDYLVLNLDLCEQGLVDVFEDLLDLGVTLCKADLVLDRLSFFCVLED